MRAEAARRPATAASPVRARWLRRLHQWHWISAAFSLVAMLLFSVTGFTLNHAASIEGSPKVTTLRAALPDALRDRFAARPARADAPLPPEVSAWVRSQFGVSVAGKPAEWSADEVYVPLPRPGGDAWLRIQPADGEVEYELTDRGWISWLNDLHKGRHAGDAWGLFIDLFAFACVAFAATGLLILKMHAASRPATWPVASLGLVLPLLLLLLFVH
ncbi:MAG: PepSY-associated TM helix domain-containing protein [Burkholderiaceae bacterium]